MYHIWISVFLRTVVEFLGEQHDVLCGVGAHGQEADEGRSLVGLGVHGLHVQDHSLSKLSTPARH